VIKQGIYIAAMLLAVLSLQGCATVYYKCATGDKAARQARMHAHVLPGIISYSRSQREDAEKVAEESVKRWDRLFSRFEKEENRDIPYKELSGREYVVKLGQSQARLLKDIGPPDKKTTSEAKGCDESWEYEHFTVYFKRRRVKDVVCKKKEGVFFSRQSDCFLDLFPDVYYHHNPQE